MSYLIKMSYDGSKFYGFQRLNEEVTVQKTLEEALTKINKQSVVIKGAGRTDRGVHANCQCASFSLDMTTKGGTMYTALNSLVKPYIYIKDVIEVDDEFHARFDVTKKRYVYKINLGEYNPIMNDYIYQCPYELDLDLMREVANLYVGGHDFRNFVSGERDNYDCIIYDIDFDVLFFDKSFYHFALIGFDFNEINSAI